MQDTQVCSSNLDDGKCTRWPTLELLRQERLHTMSYDFFPDPNIEPSGSLNREIDTLYEEVEALHGETGMLTGLMAGSFAFFTKQLMTAHQSNTSIGPQHCEQMVIDALRRVISTQHRFDADLVSEIRATLKKMNASELLQPYLDKAIAQYEHQSNG